MKTTAKQCKQLLALLVLGVLVCLLAVPARAEETGFADLYYRMNDLAGVLTAEEEDELEQTLTEISLRQNFDVAILAVSALEPDYPVQQVADAAFEQMQYGYGPERDGILLLVSVEDRAWAISTSGFGVDAFTDEGLRQLTDAVLPDLSENRYAEAFRTFARTSDAYLTAARQGAPVGSGSKPHEPLSPLFLLAALGIGFVLALIAVGAMKAQLRSVRARGTASDYVRPDSMKLTEVRDIYLYRQVVRTEKPKPQEKHPDSTTHTSASGRTHGGASGTF